MRMACPRASMPPRSPLPSRGFIAPGRLRTSLLLGLSLITVAPLISGCGGASLGVDLNTIAAIVTCA